MSDSTKHLFVTSDKRYGAITELKICTVMNLYCSRWVYFKVGIWDDPDFTGEPSSTRTYPDYSYAFEINAGATGFWDISVGDIADVEDMAIAYYQYIEQQGKPQIPPDVLGKDTVKANYSVEGENAKISWAIKFKISGLNHIRTWVRHSATEALTETNNILYFTPLWNEGTVFDKTLHKAEAIDSFITNEPVCRDSLADTWRQVDAECRTILKDLTAEHFKEVE